MAQVNPPATLYRFFDIHGVLLYVGITSVGTNRWFSHAREKGWWNEVANITTEHFPNRVAALAAEARAILNEQPIYNVSGLKAKKERLNLHREANSGSLYFLAHRNRWKVMAPARLTGGKRITWNFRTRPEAEGVLTILKLAELGPKFRRSAVEAILAVGDLEPRRGRLDLSTLSGTEA